MDRDTSLLLDQPRLLLKEEGVLPRALFYGAMMALGGLGGWGSVITAFGIPVHTVWLAAAGLICIIFSVWRQTDSRRNRWTLSLLGWVAWLLLLVFSFDSVAHGAVRTVNYMLDLYGTKLNYDLPSLRLPYSSGPPSMDVTGECTSFIIILLFPFFWAMARMWVRGRNNRAPFGLTGALLLLPMSFSILPADWAFAALLLFWCMLLLLAPSLTGNEGVMGRFCKKGYKASGVAVARPTALLLALGVGLCMWLVYLYAPLDTYKRPEIAESLRTVIREGVTSSQYLRGGQGNSNKDVQLRTLGSRAYTGETMLRVKFDWQADPEDVGIFPMEDSNGETWYVSYDNKQNGVPAANANKEYLKSFVGTVYTGDSWQRLDFQGREELQELELRAQNQISRYKHELFAVNRDKRNFYQLSVQNLGANPRCVYIPAGLKSGGDELSEYGIELVDDGYAKSGNFVSGTREYELTGESLPFGFNYFSRVISYLAAKDYMITSIGSLGSASIANPAGDEYSVIIMEDGTRVLNIGGYTPTGITMADLFDSINAQGNIAGPGWPADLWEVPEYEAWEGLDISQQEFLRDVEAYNKFVYEHYLEVPEELKDFLEDFKDAYGLDPEGRLEYPFQMKGGAQAYAATIAMMFQDYFTYTLDPPQPPQGQDFVEYFLGESHQGYCVHFATAAVMLLRAAGYPARYAEGYVVPTGGDGLGGRAEWVDVPDYNAHAWVEIYCGGTGWMPVEVTPAAPDNPAAFYDATIPENIEDYELPTPLPETERPTMPPRRNPLIDEELSSPTPGPRASAAPSPGVSGTGKASEEGPGRWLIGAAWCLCGLTAVFGAVMLQRILRIKKRQRDLGQRNKNAAGLKAYGYLLRLYEKETFCGSREDPPERWKELAEKARFSAHMLSEEELSELTGDADRLAEKLRRQLPRGQKALCWLSGLI